MTDVCIAQSKGELLRYLASDQVRSHRAQERDFASHNKDREEYCLPALCVPCDAYANFSINRNWGARYEDAVWIPNWRESLVCPMCGLNNRMRMIAEDVQSLIRCKGAAPLVVYMMEQVTAFYKWMRQAAPGSNVIGSEFLGPDIRSGTVKNGVRHENAEGLSLADGAVDLVVSNEVLEHVNDPERAIAEIARVLRVGGCLFLTTPFDPNMEASVRRAQVVSGEIHHLLPAVFHGNPLSKEGSLVVNDFGWELVSLLERAGFRSVSIVVHWSFETGHLGDVFYFKCVR